MTGKKPKVFIIFLVVTKRVSKSLKLFLLVYLSQIVTSYIICNKCFYMIAFMWEVLKRDAKYFQRVSNDA